MKGKENIKNIWRCMLVGVFVVSLFAASTTGGLALNPQPLPPGYHVSPMMFSQPGSVNAIRVSPAGAGTVQAISSVGTTTINIPVNSRIKR